MRLSRRSLLKTAARLGAGAGLALLGLGGAERSEAQEESEAPFFRESATKLTLGNQYYEVDFDRRNGGITRIFDKRGGGIVSEGNADGSLWGLSRGETHQAGSGIPWINSSGVPQSGFSWQWDRAESKLSFAFDMRASDYHVIAHIDVEVSDRPWFDLTATMENKRGQTIDWVSLPYHMTFVRSPETKVLLPHTSGIVLLDGFFAEGRTYEARYPSEYQFLDFTWIQTDSGTMAVYALFGESPWWSSAVALNYVHRDNRATPYWKHETAVALAKGDRTSVPTVRMYVGPSEFEAISAYREQNGLHLFPSLRDKAEDIYDALKRSVHITTIPEASSGLDSFYFANQGGMTPPGVLHPAVFQELGFEWTNPDWWPPGEVAGGADTYIQRFAERQREGFLVMPYSQMTLATEGSLTSNLLQEQGRSLDGIAVVTRTGNPLYETYGYWDGEKLIDPVTMALVSPADSWYKNRLESIMSWHDLAGSDLIFQDGLGSHPWVYDAHAEASSPLQYASGQMEHSAKYAHLKSGSEGISDRLARFQMGGYAPLLFSEHAGALSWAGRAWQHFPLTGSVLRDKALTWGFNFEGLIGFSDPSGRKNAVLFSPMEAFRWHLMTGHQVTVNASNAHHSWVVVASEFAKHVLGAYADELVTSFELEENKVVRTRFETVAVEANMSGEPRRSGQHTLVPEGFLVIYDDGSVTAGAFQAYNDGELSPGVHVLIEQRKDNGIIVRQPMGSDTRLTLDYLPDWHNERNVQVTSYSRENEIIERSLASVGGKFVQLMYKTRHVDDMESKQQAASIELGQVGRENGIHEVLLHSTDYVTEMREGRFGRTGIHRPETGWSGGDFALDVREQLVDAKVGRDVVVEVEYFDGWSEGDDMLYVTYDATSSSEASGGSVALQGEHRWKNASFFLSGAVFAGRLWSVADLAFTFPPGVVLGAVRVFVADELERRTVAYYTIHDPTQGESLTQGLHLRGWTDATQPIADLDLDGLQAIYAWDADAASWLLYSPDVPAQFSNIDTLEQGRAYYVRVRNGETLRWPDAPYGGVGFHLQPGRNLVCWLGTPDKPLTDAIAPLRGMKAEPLVSVTLDGRTYDVEESRSATEPLPYGQALWVEIEAVGPTRWLQF